MSWVVGDFMQVNVRTVAPELPLRELEELFTLEGVSGFPVVLGNEFQGMVTRADIVRSLSQERELAEDVSDYYFDDQGFHEVPLNNFQQIAERWGEQVDSLVVADIMSHNPIAVSPTRSLPEAATLMLQHGIHRLPVVDNGEMVGILAAFDFVKLFADRRVELRGE